MHKSWFVLFLIFYGNVTFSQKNATYKEFLKTYVTYPFSDPDPVPADKIYPYFRFDGFTNKSVKKSWKVVLLENDFISVQIMPEIGGKVWTAIEKSSNKPFFYDNDVVKFRDIAMRGPWVSGGIEANYGIIGHTPNSATPVDYLVKSNKDGSVSCFVSTLDLLTRTTWVLEIKLEKDKAYFTTRSFWFNSTGVEQPYYTWMNSAVPVGNGLKFLFPGDHYIGHDGSVHEWPINKEGRDLSYYDQNNFGDSKSYHVLGTHSNYFGALWEPDDFGMIHYAKRGKKLGKKIFLWAQSPNGILWEHLLTDNAGQYVEMQSGRLFNQNQFNSSLTPFKQIGFSPYVSDDWIEYWYPFKGVGGFSHANLIGAFNINSRTDSMIIKISPVQEVNDSVYVYNDRGEKIGAGHVLGHPLQPVEITLPIRKDQEASRIEIKGHFLDLSETDTSNKLSRPLKIADSFPYDGAYGLYLQGRDLARFRDYGAAEIKILSSLNKDSLFLPSLVEYGKLMLFQMKYDSAFLYLKKALSIDTYNGEANYYYGISASKLSRENDALDGFEVAALTREYRNAAYTALSHHYLKGNDLARAKDYTLMALNNNPENIDALQTLCVLARINKNEGLWGQTREKIIALNPLNHFVRFEEYVRDPNVEHKKDFVDLIRNEMPVETFLELAIWYANMGRMEESKTVLTMAPENTETMYWLAWLNRNDDKALSDNYLAKAAESTPDFVFPFRKETADVLKWAVEEDQKAWQPRYLLALICRYRGREAQALSLLQTDENVNFAPFYVLRARLYSGDSLNLKINDIANAISLDPEEWRYWVLKADLLSRAGKNEDALRLLEKNFRETPENYIVGLDLVRLLVANHKYQESDKVLAKLNILPFEGAMDARRYYRETKLMLAYHAIENGRYKQALAHVNAAEQWPEHLGVGKPYQDRIDDDLENFMKAKIYEKMGRKDLMEAHANKVKNKKINDSSYLELIQAITGRGDKRLF